MKKVCTPLRSAVCTDEFLAESTTNFFHRTCCDKHKNTIDVNLGYSRKNSAAQKRLVCVAKHISFMTHNQTISNLKAKAWIQKRHKDYGDGPMSKYLHVLEMIINLTSTNRGYCTKKHALATYEQTKKWLSYRIPKRNEQKDGIHTRLLKM